MKLERDTGIFYERRERMKLKLQEQSREKYRVPASLIRPSLRRVNLGDVPGKHFFFLILPTLADTIREEKKLSP